MRMRVCVFEEKLKKEWKWEKEEKKVDIEIGYLKNVVTGNFKENKLLN